MADIFISYAREDREWVEKLANQLVAEGFTVWWDWDLLVGKRYRETIETELQTAKAAVVVWSQHSIRSDFVRDEAEDAQQRNILLPLLKEIVRPPAGFRQLQTADLSAWHGDGEHIEFRRMMKGVSSLVGRTSAGDTGVIPVDPAHPTTHFTEAAPAAPTPPMDVAPVLATAPQAESPPAVVARAPEPVPAAAPATIAIPASVSPSPGVHATPTPLPAAPHKSNPIIKYIAIGAVALMALIFVVVQFVGPSTRTASPAAAVPAATTPVAAPVTPAPATPMPPPSGGSNTGGDTGGGDTGGGDEGQTGPHGSATPPVNNAVPPNNGGTDDSGANGGDSSDTGQGNTPH